MNYKGELEIGDAVSLRMATVSESGVQMPFGAGGEVRDYVEIPNRVLVAFDVEGHDEPVEAAVDVSRLDTTGPVPKPAPDDESEKGDR